MTVWRDSVCVMDAAKQEVLGILYNLKVKDGVIYILTSEIVAVELIVSY